MVLPDKRNASNLREEGVRISFPRYDVQRTQNDSAVFLYKLRLASEFAEMDDSQNVEEMYNRLKNKLHQVAREAFGVIEHGSEQKTNHWWTNELKADVKDKKLLYEKWLSTRDPEDRKSYMRQII